MFTVEITAFPLCGFTVLSTLTLMVKLSLSLQRHENNFKLKAKWLRRNVNLIYELGGSGECKTFFFYSSILLVASIVELTLFVYRLH
jgi:hypothetical protein